MFRCWPRQEVYYILIYPIFISISGRSTNPEEMEGIKDAITILENQDNTNIVTNKQSGIEIATPQPIYVNTESNVYKINSAEIKDTNPIYRGTRNYRNITTTQRPNQTKSIKNNNKSDMKQSASDMKLVTVKADVSFSQSTELSSRETTSKERVYRRRQVNRQKHSKTTTSKPTTVKPIEITSTTTETLSAPKSNAPVYTNMGTIVNIDEIKTANDFKASAEQYQHVKEETLINQEDKVEKIEPSILKEAESSPPIKRFYRSSAESSSKEIAYVQNEKVQIVRPKPYSRLVGEYPTPTAVIAQLDDAILGRNHNVRHKKEAHLTIVTPQRNKHSKEHLSST